MKTHKNPPFVLRNHVTTMVVGVLAIATSFSVGMQSAGNVRTVAPMEAADMRLSGDINHDEKVDHHDALLVLECVRGYKQVTPEMLLADPNRDGKLTIDDAMKILHSLTHTSL